MSRKGKLVGLLDCNNFFVSCERLFRPDLIGRPVAVLSSNDGCIIARSKEVKELGIPMGIPYFKVREELHTSGVVIFSSNIQLYRDISSRVMRALADHVSEYDVYSIDEAFFSLADGVETDAEKLKEVVEKWVGIPVSIGIGRNRIMAKYANEEAKREGRVVVYADTDVWNEKMRDIPCGALWGIGRKTAEKLGKHGLKTAYDVAAADPARLSELFGVEGTRLWHALRGERSGKDADTLDTQRSIMSTRAFGRTTTSKSVLIDALSYHVSHAAEKLRKEGCSASYLSIMLRTRRHGKYHLRGGRSDVLLAVPTDDTQVLVKEVLRLFEDTYEAGVPYGGAGITLGGFVPKKYVSGTLFQETDSAADVPDLMTVMDSINARHGSNTIRPGTILKDHSWKPKSEFRSPAYTTNWSEVQSVKAL